MLGRFSSRTVQAVDALPTAPVPLRPADPGEARPLQPQPPQLQQSDQYLKLKVELHHHLIDRFNLTVIEQLNAAQLQEQIRPIVRDYVREHAVALNASEIDTLVSETADEMLGLGPLEPLLADDSISDILINTHRSVYIEREGKLEPTAVRFSDEAHLMRIINKIVAGVGRRVDESSPMVDARLPDGSRVNVAIRPVSIDGPLVSIRKFARRPYTLERLVSFNSIRPAMVDLLRIAVQSKQSILVSGGTGSGKTTLLNALSNHISGRERLITIEDAAELQLQQPHVGRLETRPPNVEGKGEIRQRELVKNALRMRPDRIIIGEVRGEEAFDMLQAMNTGHEGSMTTIHANSPRDALSRLEQMIGMAGMPMSQESIRGQVASAIDLVVQTQRLSDGGRRIVSIAEITGMEGNVVQMQEIYRFVRTGTGQGGAVEGAFRATGVRPRFAAEAEALGLPFAADAFNPQAAL